MQYVTRKELREELEPIHAVLRLIVERMATKDDLARFLTKDDAARFLTKDDAARFLTRDDAARFMTKDDAAQMEARLLTEMARHIRASNEEVLARISVIDEKYAD